MQKTFALAIQDVWPSPKYHSEVVFPRQAEGFDELLNQKRGTHPILKKALLECQARFLEQLSKFSAILGADLRVLGYSRSNSENCTHD